MGRPPGRCHTWCADRSDLRGLLHLAGPVSPAEACGGEHFRSQSAASVAGPHPRDRHSGERRALPAPLRRSRLTRDCPGREPDRPPRRRHHRRPGRLPGGDAGRDRHARARRSHRIPRPGAGPGQGHTILALSFFAVPIFARNARAATLRLRELTFMTAARLCGTRTWRMLVRHIAPNILPQLITFGLLSMGAIMVIEGALSFLGLGVPLPDPSWGNMIFQGQQSISATPLLVLFPSAFLFVSVLAFNLFGDALRARWNLR